MIRTEYPYKGSENLVRHYSDSGMMIRQEETGAVYADAVDVYPSRYTYTETSIPTEDEDVTAEDIVRELESIL